MSADRWALMAEYASAEDLVCAAQAAHDAGWSRAEAYAPYAVDGLPEAMRQVTTDASPVRAPSPTPDADSM